MGYLNNQLEKVASVIEGKMEKQAGLQALQSLGRISKVKALGNTSSKWGAGSKAFRRLLHDVQQGKPGAEGALNRLIDARPYGMLGSSVYKVVTPKGIKTSVQALTKPNGAFGKGGLWHPNRSSSIVPDTSRKISQYITGNTSEFVAPHKSRMWEISPTYWL